MPALSARVRIRMGSTDSSDGYALRGTAEEIAAEIRAYAEIGVTHLLLAFPERDPEGLDAATDRFMREVAPLV